MLNFQRVLMFITATLLLQGCIADDIILQTKSDYKIAGVEEDEETQAYLDKILDERLEPAPEEDKKTEAEKKRHEDYRERLIQSSLVKGLKAKGYYDAEVDYNDSQEELKGTYVVRKGDLYKISEISIKPKQFRSHINALTIQKNLPLEAKPVLKSQAEFYEAIQKDECYFNLNMSHQVVLDRKSKTAKVIYDVEAGPKSVFDEVVFEGQETVETSYLKKLIPFKEGECFRREKIETLRSELLATNLFARAKIDLPETPVDGDKVPINVTLKERAHRTVRVGASFYTDEGPGVVLGWKHRNFLGAAEKLEAQIKASQRQQFIGLDLTKPFFLRKDQSLSLNAALNREDSDAFNELSIGAGANISRQFHKRLNGSTGVELKVTRIEDKNTLERENFGLLSFPNALTFDNRDNKLNPHRGWHIRGIAEPFLDVLGNSSPFFKTRLSASTYFGFHKDTVLALRASVGSINGADIEDIPATERFYSGGGGSVRGFGYQEVGPTQNGDPSGGASVVEGAVELRFKVTDTIGAVAFVDAGNVNEDAAPNFSDLSIGAGVGLRYYTSFGPLRLDVATPITNKEFTESNYQVYISIGQAF